MTVVVCISVQTHVARSSLLPEVGDFQWAKSSFFRIAAVVDDGSACPSARRLAWSILPNPRAELQAESPAETIMAAKVAIGPPVPWQLAPLAFPHVPRPQRPRMAVPESLPVPLPGPNSTCHSYRQALLEASHEAPLAPLACNIAV